MACDANDEDHFLPSSNGSRAADHEMDLSHAGFDRLNRRGGEAHPLMAPVEIKDGRISFMRRS